MEVIEAPVIGIDLGTTYSCVGVYQNEKPHIIDIKDGNETSKTMASVVSYTKNGRIIGNSVKENFRLDPTSTIYGVKRFIGRRYNEITDLMQNYPVTVVNDDNNPKFQIEFKQDELLLTPEEVSAAILEKLKTSAENYLGMEVTKAVITVPANFNDSQRQATINAGRIAGLDVLRIVNEPTAASFAYGIHDKYRDTNNPCNLLVYDFGGGTFDISIITITDCLYEVKATNGDTLLGGDDIDQLILNHFTNLFQTKYEKHLAQDRRAMRRLRLQCEKLKRELSLKEHANISLDSLHEGIDFESELSRTEFEAFCKPLFERTLQLLEETLTQAKLNKSDIDEIILVGGTTRIPKIREMVAEFFDGKELNMSLNPDETVALGAAVQAAILDTNSSNTIVGSLLLIDVNSLSLGVELIGGRMDIIIPRNTQIPVEITKTFVTTRDNQETVKVSVYEGEHLKVSENTLLGSFLFQGITPAARGQTKISLSYLINTDGILKITAVELTKNVSKSLDLVMDKYRLSDDEINQLIARSQELQDEEKEWADRIQASLDVRNYCMDTINMVEEIGKQIKEEQREIVLIKCNEILKWLDQNEDELKSVYEDIKKEVFYICNPIMKHYL